MNENKKFEYETPLLSAYFAFGVFAEGTSGEKDGEKPSEVFCKEWGDETTDEL